MDIVILFCSTNRLLLVLRYL